MDNVCSAPTACPSTPVSTGAVQHRLMLKQTPIDTWSFKEQLGLASAVLRSGDQNWVSVSRQMKPFSEEQRPSDWFSQKNCALQYNLLLEQVDTPRRKRGGDRTVGGAAVGGETVETPGEAIVKRLTADRIRELQQNISKEAEEIRRIEMQVELLSNEDVDMTDEQLDEIQAEMDLEDLVESEKKAVHAQWLAEREEKKRAIQTALKMHSSKVPLKGAAAAAQLAGAARRASSQSEASSGLSDIDSPAPPPPPVAASFQTKPSSDFEPLPKPDEDKPAPPSSPPVAAKTSEESSTSPLLSSIPKSPTWQTNAPEEDLDTFTPPISKSVPSPAETEETAVTVENNAINVEDADNSEVPSETVKSVEEEEVVEEEEEVEVPTVEEKVSAIDQSPEHPVQEELDDAQPTEVKPEIESANEIEVSQQEVKTETGEETSTQQPPVETTAETTADSHVKEEENRIVDETELMKRPTRPAELKQNAPSGAAGRPTRSKRSSEVSEDDGDEERIPTRSRRRQKRNSERSNEDPAQDDNSNDSALSSSSKTTRGLRSSKRGFAELEKEEEKEDSSTVIENKRLSRVRDSDKEVRGRKSVSAAASRSNSPLGTGDESDGEQLKTPYEKRSSRRRRRSGKSHQQEVADSNPPSPAASVASSFGDEKHSAPASDKQLVEWRRQMSQILEEIKSHKLFGKVILEDASKFPPDYHQVVLKPLTFNRLKTTLHDGLISSTVEFHRNVALLFVNATMYSASNSEVHRQAQDMFRDVDSLFSGTRENASKAVNGKSSTKARSSSSKPTPSTGDRGRKRGHGGDTLTSQNGSKKKKR